MLPENWNCQNHFTFRKQTNDEKSSHAFSLKKRRNKQKAKKNAQTFKFDRRKNSAAWSVLEIGTRTSVSVRVSAIPSINWKKKNAFHMGRSQKQSVALTKRKCNRKNAHGEWRHSSRNDYWFRNNNNISIYRKNNEIFSSRTVSLRSKLDLLTPKHQSRRKW